MDLVITIGGVETGVEPALTVDLGNRVAWDTHWMSWPQDELIQPCMVDIDTDIPSLGVSDHHQGVCLF